MSWLSKTYSAIFFCFFFLVFISFPECYCDEFPFLEFVKSVVPDARIPADLTTLQLKYLCYFNSGESRSYTNCCNCNDDCFIEGSCCIDKLWNSTTPLPLDKYLENFQQRFDDVSTRCLPALPSATQYIQTFYPCLLYTSPSPRDLSTSRMPSSA